MVEENRDGTMMGGNPGFYPTAFFLRGYYQPNTGGNNAAQFCRQCHSAKRTSPRD